VQTLSAQIKAGTYTLTVFVKTRKLLTPGNWKVAILASDAEVASETQAHYTISPGALIPVTVTYEVSSSDPNIGKDLGVSLASLGGSQTNFDNVSLDYLSPYPHPPCSWEAGLLALNLLGWQRKQD
jgi:hypothetical protein